MYRPIFISSFYTHLAYVASLATIKRGETEDRAIGEAGHYELGS